ncbi:MAG: hypothetical protein SGPRY_012484 [Prymnesium sp.]
MSSWNKFDLFVLGCSTSDLILTLCGIDLRTLRATRAGRIFRLLRVSSSMMRFEATIVQARTMACPLAE